MYQASSSLIEMWFSVPQTKHRYCSIKRHMMGQLQIIEKKLDGDIEIFNMNAWLILNNYKWKFDNCQE